MIGHSERSGLKVMRHAQSPTKKVGNMTNETEEMKRLKSAADTWQLQRIADALEEILRLVKQDMQKYEKKKN